MLRVSLVLIAITGGVASGCASSAPNALPPAGLYTLSEARTLGASDGVAIRDGGLSGLDLFADGRLVAVTDRGPNLDAETAAGRPAKRFPLPGYAPHLVTLRASGQTLRVQARTPIIGSDGPVSGRPVEARTDVIVETATGPDGETLAPDPWGIDAEGIADAADGTVWVCDEYRPSLWRLDAATGRVLDRFTPTPTEALDRPLPPVLTARTANLGFEGVALVQTADGARLVAALQGPLQPDGAAPGTPLARLLVLDPQTGDAHTLAHALDGPLRKIGDLAALPDGRLLAIEHGLRPDGSWSADLVVLDLASGRSIDDTATPPEAYLSASEATAAGIGLVPRQHLVDLVAAGWPAEARKPEGLAVRGRRVAVLSDNDYGLDSPQADGRAVATGVETVLLVFDLPRAP